MAGISAVITNRFSVWKNGAPEKKLTSGYPVFSSYGITGYTDEYMFANPTLVVLARGVSGTGEVRILPRFCYITNLSIALLLKDSIYFAYLYEYLAHDNLRSLDSGSAQSMITIENLGRHKIAIPPKELAEQFNLTAKNLFAIKEHNERESECLNKLLEILLSELSR